MPALSDGLQDEIRAMLPPFASPVNPVDVTPVWSRYAELYPALTELLARSGEVDVVVPVLLQRAALDAPTAEGAARRRSPGLRADGVAGAGARVLGGAPRRAAQRRPAAGARACRASNGRPARRGPIGHARRYALARERAGPSRPLRRRTARADADRPRRRRGAAGRVRHRDGAVAAVSTADERPSRPRTAFPVGGQARRRPRTAPSSAGSGSGSATPPRSGPRRPTCWPDRARCWCNRSSPASRWPSARCATRCSGRWSWSGSAGSGSRCSPTSPSPWPRCTAPRPATLLTGLRGYPLLTGARGRPPVDLDALADVVVGAGQPAARRRRRHRARPQPRARHPGRRGRGGLEDHPRTDRLTDPPCRHEVHASRKQCR